MSKRFVAAVVLALALAVVLRVGHRVMSVVVPSQCEHLDPDVNWFLYWWYGCPTPPAGGGGSGAS
jgi:hypothetical protein